MNRNLIIAIIVIIVIAAVGAFALTQANSGAKIDTKINFSNETSYKNGDKVVFELTEANGNPIAGQQLNISFQKDGNNENFTVVTDSNGRGYLLIENEPAGDSVLIITYNGSDKYNSSVAQKTITIEEGESDSTSDDSTPTDTNSSASTQQYSNESSQSSSSSSNLHYDSEYNFYYDDDGIIRGGQSDGMSAEEVRNNYKSGDMIDSEGNLQ